MPCLNKLAARQKCFVAQAAHMVHHMVFGNFQKLMRNPRVDTQIRKRTLFWGADSKVDFSSWRIDPELEPQGKGFERPPLHESDRPLCWTKGCGGGGSLFRTKRCTILYLEHPPRLEGNSSMFKPVEMSVLGLAIWNRWIRHIEWSFALLNESEDWQAGGRRAGRFPLKSKKSRWVFGFNRCISVDHYASEIQESIRSKHKRVSYCKGTFWLWIWILEQDCHYIITSTAALPLYKYIHHRCWSFKQEPSRGLTKLSLAFPRSARQPSVFVWGCLPIGQPVSVDPAKRGKVKLNQSLQIERRRKQILRHLHAFTVRLVVFWSSNGVWASLHCWKL